jgi:hypothetical protein
MTFINQRFVTSCMGARAVRGRFGWSDWGSDTWDIEIPAIDKASLYQKMVTCVANCKHKTSKLPQR